MSSWYSAWFGSTPWQRAESWKLLGLAALLAPAYVVAMLYLKVMERT